MSNTTIGQIDIAAIAAKIDAEERATRLQYHHYEMLVGCEPSEQGNKEAQETVEAMLTEAGFRRLSPEQLRKVGPAWDSWCRGDLFASVCADGYVRSTREWHGRTVPADYATKLGVGIVRNIEFAPHYAAWLAEDDARAAIHA